MNKGESESVIQVFHYSKDSFRTHSTPFSFIIKQGERFSQTKERLLARCCMNEKEFSKVKFTYFSSGYRSSQVIEDGIIYDIKYLDTVVASLDLQGVIGMDHIDKGAKKLAPAEKAIKIWN